MKLQSVVRPVDYEDDPRAAKLLDVVEGYADDLAKVPGAATGSVVATVNPSNGGWLQLDIILRDADGGRLMAVTRKFYFAYNTQSNHLFELSGHLQGKGLGKTVDRMSLAMADALDMSKIKLNANLTAGGYVWLRRGFWPAPDDPILDEIVYYSDLPGSLKDKWAKMSYNQKRKFVLTDKFREYKPAFMGSDWEGYGVVSDPAFRRAYLGAEPVAKVVDPRLTAQERYRDAVLRYEVDLRRYTAQQQEDLTKFLAAQDRLLAARLKELDPGQASTYTHMRQELQAMSAATVTEAQSRVTREMEEFAQVAGSVEVSMLGQSLPFLYEFAAPSPQKLKALISTVPFQGKLMSRWFTGLKAATGKRLWATVKAGIALGETTPEIVRRVIGTQANNYTDGVLSETRRNANALVRTAVNHVSNTARQEVWEANSDVIDGRIWLSTLDGRTTLLCGSRDHKFAPLSPGGKVPVGLKLLDPPDARPPAHWNCRSTTIAYMNGVALLGDRPSVVDTRTRSGREVDFRQIAKAEGKTIQQVRKDWAEKAVGQVPGKTGYDTWLRSQSAGFQDEVLGPSRGALYREGGMTVDQFTDASGHKYTLEQLQAKYRQPPLPSTPPPGKIPG